MNKDKKNYFKANAFDVFVFLLVLCLIATVAYRIYTSIAEDRNAKSSFLSLTFTCENEYDSITEYLKEGDAVYLPSGELLGYIAKGAYGDLLFETVTEGTTADTENGEEATEEITFALASPKKYSVITFNGEIKLNGNAVKSSKGSYYKIGDDAITVGGTLLLHTENTQFTVRVNSINEIYS